VEGAAAIHLTGYFMPEYEMGGCLPVAVAVAFSASISHASGCGRGCMTQRLPAVCGQRLMCLLAFLGVCLPSFLWADWHCLQCYAPVSLVVMPACLEHQHSSAICP
jgi:hypothetical protein